MLSLRGDSTISSKMSEYDNVPILPSNYHNHLNHDDFSSSPPTLIPGFPLDDPPPVPPHQMSLSIPSFPHQLAQTTPPFPHQVPSSTPTFPHHVPLSASTYSHLHNHQQHSPPLQRPLQFPTEKNMLGQDLGYGQQQQQVEQEEYESLDHRLVLQHKRLHMKQPQQDQLQQQEQQPPQQQEQQPPQQEQQPPQPQPEEQSASSPPPVFKASQEKLERSHRDSYGGEMSTSSSMIFYCLVFLAEILMFGLLSLVLFWAVYYRGGFDWRDDEGKQFNFHPVLMICGFIFFMGHAMLVYRLFRCCNKLTAKILHTFLYLMAVPCIVVGTIAVFDFHNLRDPPIPNLYSIHSWLGLVTIGLFALQVTHTLVVGFFSFWFLLCCEQGTARFRAGLVPIHATFGIITFMLAIATAVTGYTEKAIFSLRDPNTKEILYSRMENEAIVINTQAAALAALGILVPVMVALRPFRRRWSDRLTEHL